MSTVERHEFGGPERTVRRFAHGSRVPGWDEAVDLTKAPAVVPDPATTPVPDDLRAEIEALMARYPDSRSASIPAMHVAQDRYGWLSPDALAQVACVMRLTPAYLTSVASFYDMFALTPKPSHDVYVCTNITCSLLGADEFYDRMCAAADGNADIGVRGFECLGACDIGPMASVDGEYVGPLNLEDAEQIVQDIDADRPVLEHKQLRFRACADREAASATPWGADSAGPRAGNNGDGEPVAEASPEAEHTRGAAAAHDVAPDAPDAPPAPELEREEDA